MSDKQKYGHIITFRADGGQHVQLRRYTDKPFMTEFDYNAWVNDPFMKDVKRPLMLMNHTVIYPNEN